MPIRFVNVDRRTACSCPEICSIAWRRTTILLMKTPRLAERDCGVSHSFANLPVIAYTILRFQTNLPGGAYSNSVLQAPPVSCRGGARFPATITRLDQNTPPPALLLPAVVTAGRRRAGGGVGWGAHFVAPNQRHPGTRPGEPVTEKTLNR